MKLNHLQKFYLSQIIKDIPKPLEIVIKAIINNLLNEDTRIQKEAYISIMRLLSSDEPLVIFLFGFCNAHGIGTQKLPSIALNYFNKIQHYPPALTAKAAIHMENNQRATAKRCLTLAMSKEFVLANYLYGELIKAKPNESQKYNSIAAKAGFADAQFNRAKYFHLKGKLKEAKKWYIEAAKQGHIESKYELSLLFAQGIEENGKIKIDLEASFNCCFDAASAGERRAANGLALKFLRGEGIEVNIKSAIDWFEIACKNNYVSIEAQFEFAKIYADNASDLIKACQLLCNVIKKSRDSDNETNKTIVQYGLQATAILTSLKDKIMEEASQGNGKMQEILSFMFRMDLILATRLEESEFLDILSQYESDKETKYSKELDLSGRGIVNSFLDAFEWALKNNKTLEKLNLSGNPSLGHPYNKSNMKILKKILYSHPHIKIIHLDGCNLDNDDAKIIADALYRSSTITELSLCGNEISSDQEFDDEDADDLSQDEGNYHLDFENSDGLLSIMLALALNNKSALKNLWLADNHLDLRGLNFVAKALETNRSLCSITFGSRGNETFTFGNTLYTPTVNELRKMLKDEENLTYDDKELYELINFIQNCLLKNQAAALKKKEKLDTELAEQYKKLQESLIGSSSQDLLNKPPLTPKSNGNLQLKQFEAFPDVDSYFVPLHDTHLDMPTKSGPPIAFQFSLSVQVADEEISKDESLTSSLPEPKFNGTPRPRPFDFGIKS